MLKDTRLLLGNSSVGYLAFDTSSDVNVTGELLTAVSEGACLFTETGTAPRQTYFSALLAGYTAEEYDIFADHIHSSSQYVHVSITEYLTSKYSL